MYNPFKKVNDTSTETQAALKEKEEELLKAQAALKEKEGELLKAQAALKEKEAKVQEMTKEFANIGQFIQQQIQQEIEKSKKPILERVEKLTAEIEEGERLSNEMKREYDLQIASLEKQLNECKPTGGGKKRRKSKCANSETKKRSTRRR